MESQKPKLFFDSDIKNDVIDIYGNIDVKLTVKPVKVDNELRIIIEGKNIDNSVVNAIRRTILQYIPIYGFHKSNTHIEIERTKCMYNNDLINNQITTLCIYDIPNFFDLEDPEMFLTNEVMKHLFMNFIQEKFLPDDNNDANDNTQTQDANKKLFKIDLSLNYKNTSSSDYFVGTHDCVLRVNNKISNSYKIREKTCLLVLKPGEEISLSAQANLGIAKMDQAYEATTNAFFIKHSETNFELSYETLGQLDKNIIFEKACVILVKKLQYLNKYIKKKYNMERNNDEEIVIEIYGEEHTIGYLLSTALQKRDLIETAAYSMPHPFSDFIVIKYLIVSDSKIGPIRVLTDTVEYLIKLFTEIINKTQKLKK